MREREGDGVGAIEEGDRVERDRERKKVREGKRERGLT